MVALLLLAGALVVAGCAPRERLGQSPRDGPHPSPPNTETSPATGSPPRSWWRGTPPAIDAVQVAADIDLFAACLSSGLSTHAAAEAVASVAGPDTRRYWYETASLLGVGARADRAWGGMKNVAGLAEIARLVVRTEDSGAAIAAGCARLTDTLREDAQAQATARAERAGVLISLPLAVCFLPAFIILGLVPIVISLGSQML